MKFHKTKIDISSRFLSPEVLGKQGMSEIDCIAEFIANSFDWNVSRLDDKAITNILVEFGDDFIQVIDNGEGMNIEQLDKAINLGEDSGDYRGRETGDEKKGMYGMGLKTSALTLGYKFTITTISIEDPDTEYQFEFDSENGKSNPNYMDSLKINYDEKPNDSILRDFKSGTCIKIEKLVLKETKSLEAIKVRIEERFFIDISALKDKNLLNFKFVKDGYSTDVVKLNIEDWFKDKILKSDFESPSKWMKRKEYKYIGKDGNEYQLKGYLQLLNKRSISKREYGLHLYYRGQLIERFHKGKLFDMSGRKGERTFGVLHLDGCTPDQNKSRGFVEDEIFENVLNLIKEDFKVYNKLGNTTGIAKTLINDEINRRKGIGSKHGGEIEKPVDVDPVIPDTPPVDDPLDDYPEGTIKITKNLYICVNSSRLHNKALSATHKLSWEPIYNPDTKIDKLYELSVYINQDSALYKSISSNYYKTSDQDNIKSFFTKVAVCESINQKLIDEHDYTVEEARKVTDTKVYPEVLKMNLDK
jgi:hypothetical protein